MTQNLAESTWNIFKNTLHSRRNLLITNTYHKITLKPFGNKSEQKTPKYIFHMLSGQILMQQPLIQAPLHEKELKSTHFTPKKH